MRFPARHLARPFALLGLVIACVCASGCEKTGPVSFMMNEEGVEPLSVQLEREREVKTAQAESDPEMDVEGELADFKAEFEDKEQQLKYVIAMFGTPDDPMVPPGTGLDLAQLRRAAGPTGGQDVEAVRDENNAVIEPGYRLGGLYREHCVHCHGITGDGAGPTARFLDPYPRDYRQGIFKYTSTKSKEKPTTDDLARTLRDGLHGTAMPAFGIALPPDEINALVEYVKYLAIRGEVEIFLRDELFDGGNNVFGEDGTINTDIVSRTISLVVNNWNNVTVVEPVPRPIPYEDMTAEEKQASIDHGRELFRGSGQCVKCHGPAGLGDGGQLNYDDWNKDKALVEDLELRSEMWLLPLQELKARNLQLGVFRGGRRPIDIYRRIANGITGTPMPAANVGGSAIEDPDTGEMIDPMQAEEIWNIVDYVLSLQYTRGFRRPSPEMTAPNAR